MIHKTVDARGLKCPLPILHAKKALRNTPGGAVLEVLATDPGADADFVDFCRITGATLLESTCVQGVYRILLRTAA